MDAKQHLEQAIRLTEKERPAMAQTLRDLVDHLSHPEKPNAITPREALQEISIEADTLGEEVENARLRAGLL